MTRCLTAIVMLLATELARAQAPTTAPTASSIMYKMMAGQPVLIECWGASTYLGTDPVTNTRTADNPPAILERVLRRYYGNDAIQVLNPSIAGIGTSAMVKNWAARMKRSSAHLIYMGYGINDVTGQPQNPAISALEFTDNLEQMIAIAQDSGKAVILDAPHAIADWRPGIAEQLRIFAEATRSVAAHRGLPLVDSFAWSEAAYSAAPNMIANLPDAVHLNTELLKAKGYLMAGALIQPAAMSITGPAYVPSNTSRVTAHSVHRAPRSTVVPAVLGSRGNTTTCAESYTIGVNLDAPFLDLYVSTSLWSNGPTQVEVQLDDTFVGYLNLRYPSEGAALDQEIMIAESLAPGFHVVTLKADFGACVPLSYLRTQWTRRPAGRPRSAPGEDSLLYREVTGQQLEVTADASEFHALTDIPVSRFLRAADVVVDADFAPGQGVILFAHPRAMGSRVLPPRGGFYLYLNADKKLTVKEWTGTGFSEPYVLSCSATYEGKRRYSIRAEVDGRINVSVDGSEVGAYTTSSPLIGGFIGVYSEQPGRVLIDQVAVH